MCYIYSVFTPIFLIPYLINHVYTIDKIKTRIDDYKEINISFFFIKIYLSLLYTGFIFFGVKFTLERLRYSEKLTIWKLIGLFYFMIMYLSGLVCLGYLANYIIKT